MQTIPPVFPEHFETLPENFKLSSESFKSFEPASHLELVLKHLQARVTVKNIKLKSLVNILTNSYTDWKSLNPNQKYERAYQTVQELDQSGLIQKNPDGTYDIFSSSCSNPSSVSETAKLSGPKRLPQLDQSSGPKQLDQLDQSTGPKRLPQLDQSSEQIVRYLSSVPSPQTALDISKALFGERGRAQQVNSTLYALEREGRVHRLNPLPNTNKPLWQS